MERKVIKIEARPLLISGGERKIKQRRVAAYARVSTSSEEQLVSFEAQKDYYEKYILAYPNWVFAGLYVDEGISGVSLRNRAGFNRMINDAMEGNIDLIITKSISRFARNTVDTLTTVRMLKEKGVEVYFEKEQIFSLDSKGEFVLTLLSSMAQEESRSISENVKWGCRKRMSDGKYSVPYKHFLGYKKGSDNKPEIVTDQAKIIRYIYRLFLEGRTPSNIAAILKAEGIPSSTGKQTWQVRSVINILNNEKYYGAALLQKTFTEDFMTKRQRTNKGELPQYYIEKDHKPIISKDVFEEVQYRISQATANNASHNIFSNKLFCGVCGGKYGRKIVGSYKDSHKYRRAVWMCNHRYDHAEKCAAPHLYEEVIIHAFNEAVQWQLRNNPSVMVLCLKIISSSIRAARKVSKADRVLMIKDFMADFLDFSPQEIPFNESAWRIIIERADITQDKQMILRFIDESEYTYIIPKYSPIRNREELR